MAIIDHISNPFKITNSVGCEWCYDVSLLSTSIFSLLKVAKLFNLKKKEKFSLDFKSNLR